MVSKGKVKEKIEELNEEAREIESLINTFFRQVSVEYKKKDVNIGIYIWKNNTDSEEARREARILYEQWEAKAEELVKEYRPSKRDEFSECYREVRENLGLGGGAETTSTKATIKTSTFNALDVQIGILRGVSGKIEMHELRAKRQISRRVAKDEIEQAWSLFDEDFIRASGVVAAVSVERKLLTMCDESEEVEEYEPTHGIARLAQTLHDNDEIDKTEWNDLRAMASIRETCAHAEEPEKPAVRRLISDAESFIYESN